MNIKPDFKMLNKREHQFNKVKTLVDTKCSCSNMVKAGEDKYTHVVRNGYGSLEYIEPLCTTCAESHEDFIKVEVE